MSVQQGPLDLAHLSDTICVVTGAANGGIGYGICEIASGLGLHCAVLDLHQNVCRDAASSLSAAYPGQFVGVKCDVTSPSDLSAAHAAVLAAFPGKRIGAVFANAGVLFPANGIMNSSIENWKLTFDVNVIGVVNTIKEFVPSLQASTEPSVLCTTASIGGLMKGPPNLADYCSSKHAVVCLTEALSLELSTSDPHIRVCICCPCIVGTGLFLSSQTNKSAKQGETVEAATPEKGGLAPSEHPLAMTPKNHGQQVWDRIQAGEFYMICDNIPPYVNHDFPLDGAGMVQHRFEALSKPDFQRSIDNSRSFQSPMNKEMMRLQRGVVPKPRL